MRRLSAQDTVTVIVGDAWPRRYDTTWTGTRAKLVGSGLPTMPNASEMDRSAGRYSSGLVRTAG